MTSPCQVVKRKNGNGRPIQTHSMRQTVQKKTDFFLSLFSEGFASIHLPFIPTLQVNLSFLVDNTPTRILVLDFGLFVRAAQKRKDLTYIDREGFS